MELLNEDNYVFQLEDFRARLQAWVKGQCCAALPRLGAIAFLLDDGVILPRARRREMESFLERELTLSVSRSSKRVEGI